MTLNAIIAGRPETTEPLVLLHGFGGGAFVWDSVVAALDCPVIVYDLPGHGGSLHAEGIGGAGRMAKAVLADLDRRGITRFFVAGHSLGGACAALMAMRRPEQVAALGLLAPGGIGSTINHRALFHFAFARNLTLQRMALEVMMGFNAEVPETLVEETFLSHTLPGAPEALKAVYDAMLEHGVEGVRQGTLSMEAIAALPMPIHAMWGSEDCILPVAHATRLPDNVTLHRLGQAGHMLIDECPGQVIALINDLTGR